jgi:hypothetical protein
MKIPTWLIGLASALVFLTCCAVYEVYINKNFNFGGSDFSRNYQDCGAQVVMHAGQIAPACSK